jgi:peptide/nickel transport system permease protein
MKKQVRESALLPCDALKNKKRRSKWSMWKYVVKRLLWMLVTIVGVAFVIFTILYFTPGDPAELLLGDTATEADIANLHTKLGLDEPYIVQLGNYLYQTFIQFDLGTSWLYKVSVMDELMARLPRTVGIGLATMILTACIGLPLGIFAARHQGTWMDYGVIGICMVFVSLPGLWLSIECVIIFSLELGWLPANGIGSFSCYILPVFTGIFAGVANNARQMRSSMLETIRADFITTARAKGQKESKVVTKHMLPNAMMPVITMMGGAFSHIVAGSTITEKIFGIPGVGLYLLNGINYRDYPVVRGCTMFLGIFSIVVMFFMDLCYAWLDPRIKAQYEAQGAKGLRKKV